MAKPKSPDPLPADTRRVKFIHAVASEDFSYRPGEVVDLDAALADAWVAAERCEFSE